MRINFECPKCGHDDFEEIMGGVTVTSTVSSFASYYGEGSLELQYTDQNNESGEIERYQCGRCGFKLTDTSEELYEWLKEHGMLEPEEGDVTDVVE